MDLMPRQTKSEAVQSAEWLLSQHGVDTALTITLNLATFIAGTHYVAADGYIPAGTPVKIASGLYVPAANADTTAAGYLFQPIKVNAGATRAGASLFWHGVVKKSALNNAFAPNALPPQIYHA